MSLLAPLILAALCPVRPWHVLSSAAFLQICGAPKATASWHVAADGRSGTEHKLALLIIGELFTSECCVVVDVDHVVVRLVQ